MTSTRPAARANRRAEKRRWGSNIENDSPSVVARDFIALAPRLPPLLARFPRCKPHHNSGPITTVEYDTPRVALATTLPRPWLGIAERRGDAHVTSAVSRCMCLPGLVIAGASQTQPNSTRNDANIPPDVLSHPPRVVACGLVAFAQRPMAHLVRQRQD
ncbi:hypothetical protein FRC07_001965 [Ceratobasidium sp. 392]|nr:hypothetical protein FRC07_001965 [Ceratobasidium sp. 392]